MIGILCLLYTTIISLVINDDIQNLVLLTQESENLDNMSKELGGIIIQVLLLAIPLFVITWFSPLLISFNDFNCFKSIKSSIAGTLLYIFPILLAWIILLGCFFSIIFIGNIIFSLINIQGSSILSFLASLFILISFSGYISALFAFQYITYKDIFRDLEIK